MSILLSGRCPAGASGASGRSGSRQELAVRSSSTRRRGTLRQTGRKGREDAGARGARLLGTLAPCPTSPLGREWSGAFFLPTSLFPFGEGFAPPPTPSLGSGRGVREGVERPRWLKMAPRGPQRARDGLQDGSRWLKMSSNMLQKAPRPPQDGSKWPPSIPKRAPDGLQDRSR